MKKNISINISGIIFHIEEDGYEALRKYLDSINRYFGSFEDSSEILADIESRIAEIFLSRLNEVKQVITGEDVQQLIATMGSVNDFKAAEEEPAGASAAAPEPRQGEPGPSAKAPPSRKLYRDQKRKILGGVCAGLGNYFNVDPVWPRLLFALLIFATFSLILFVYIILWIALPGSEELDESNIKKMYRDPDNKVVGGVASGVAAFFGADITLIRILFVIFTIFFGTGFLVYIILWIALPEARTITDKMKMQGEPVTLSNIESSIKKGLNEKEAGEESMLTRIVLFPFRMIAALLTGIAGVLGPVFKAIIDIFRIAIGLLISATGIMFLITLIMITTLWFGVISTSAMPEWSDLHAMNLPLDPLREAFPMWTIIAAVVALAIPAVYLFLLGCSIIVRRIIFHSMVGWGLFVLFFICLIYLGIAIPRIVYGFKVEGEFKSEKTFPLTGGMLTLKSKEVGMDDYNHTRLSLHGYDGKEIKLVQHFESQGPTRMAAQENAQMVDYHVAQQDSLITFDSNITFKKDAKFRGQRLVMDLYLPYEKKFLIASELWPMIENHWRNEFNGAEDIRQFAITKTGKLECTTCPAPEKDMSGLNANDQFGLKDFEEIEMSGVFDAIIQQGDEFSIQLDGGDTQRKLYHFEKNGETLNIRYETSKRDFWKETFEDRDLVKLTITMPHLLKLSAKGAGKLKLRGFDESETKLSLTGAISGDARMSANELSLDMTGPVVFELDGRGDFLDANLTGTSVFRGTNYAVNRAIIEAHGLAQARVNVSQSLEIEKDITSNVHYTGDPHTVEINGNVKRDQN